MGRGCNDGNALQTPRRARFDDFGEDVRWNAERGGISVAQVPVRGLNNCVVVALLNSHTLVRSTSGGRSGTVRKVSAMASCGGAFDHTQ